MNTDSEVILNALQKERDELHAKIMQIDRIIKRVKSLEYSHDVELKPNQLPADNMHPKEPEIQLFPKKVDIKVLVLRAMDIIGYAANLKTIQEEYNKISGNTYNIRESVRTLQKNKLVRLMRDINMTRGYLWIKTEWLTDGQLADKYKPEGFDMLYKPENITFE